jgi:hypothetical protein
MQTSPLTQQLTSAAWGFSETLMSHSALQWRALDGSSAGSSDSSTASTLPADTVALSPAAQATAAQGKNSDDMQSLLGLMQGILQQVLGMPFATQSALPGKDTAAASAGTTQAAKTASGPESGLDGLTSSILSALGQSPDAAKSGGSGDSLLAALKHMGTSLAGDAMNLYQSLATQSQAQRNDFMAQTAAQGGSGSYSSQIAVQETESFSFSAHGKVTTASGQTYEFSLQVELQASVSIASTQSGTFGTQGSQALTLGNQAGSFSGAGVDYRLQSLQQSAGGTSAATNAPHKATADAPSSVPTENSRPSMHPLAMALAHLKLWQPSVGGKDHGHRRELAALLQAVPQQQAASSDKNTKHAKDNGDDSAVSAPTTAA